MRKIILIFCFLISCNERLETSYEDMKKYPEVLPFILSNKDFRGEHILDREWLHFSYKPKPSEDIIFKLDSIATKEKWEIKEITNLRRVYLKEIKSYPADEGLDTLFVEFVPKDNLLQFKWH